MYECPSCGAGLIFNPKSQMLECNYCGNKFTPKEIEQITLKTAKGEKGVNIENEEPSESTYNAIIYRCTQCGAELITTDETISTFCSYCGSTALIERKNVKTKKPDYIIPFKKTKEECQTAYKKKIDSLILAPKNFAEEQQIEKIRGIYMPYWIYTYEKDGVNTAKGKKYRGRRGDYIYYDDYTLESNIKAKYSGILHDASANFSDRLSEAIAPFKISEKKPFSPTYLNGFYADAEDVNEETYKREVNQLVNTEASKELAKDRTYARYSSNPSVNLESKSVELGLFPVYFLATKNKTGERISYAVINGQTGKVVAEVPIDFKKYVITSILLAIPIFLVLSLIFTITPIKVLIIDIIFSIISIITIFTQQKKIAKREKMEDDKGYISKAKIELKENKKKNTHIIKPIIGLILAIIILIINPVSDLYYYIGATISIIMIILSFSDIVKGLNLLTTRELPQLQKRGGEEYE